MEWVFLENILLKLSFHANWLDMVMNYVTPMEYRVRLNSEITERDMVIHYHRICFSCAPKAAQPF